MIRRCINVLLTTLVTIVHGNASTAQSLPGHGVEVDLAFVDGGLNDQQLDLYSPGTAGFPTLLFVHEGSLTSGDRKDDPYARMCETFQASGIGCAAMKSESRAMPFVDPGASLEVALEENRVEVHPITPGALS